MPSFTLEYKSTQASIVSRAHLKSDSLNSYFLDHPKGVYLSLSATTELNHEVRKYKWQRSLGSFIFEIDKFFLSKTNK